MRINLDRVSVSEDGEGFQVSFDTQHDNDKAYVIIQRHFEEPDDGRCYIETHHKNYRGHFWIVSANLGRKQLSLQLQRDKATRMEVSFDTSVQNFNELKRVLSIMIPQLEIADTENPC